MQSVVNFENVCFSYDNYEVLHKVSFDIEPNSFIGIVGPNGGGKTTLLRLMLGLEKPERGKITLFNDSPQNARNKIGYVIQHLHYDDKFPVTVKEIVLMGRVHKNRWGPYKALDKEIAMESLDQVGMSDFSNRSFSTLSGGQRQRVLIAQALAGEPKLLLLDEPTANIDREGEDAIHKLLYELANKLTVVSVSHNINTVLKCVSHVLCVNKSVAINCLENLHPDILAQARGGDIAVLHHVHNCQVYKKPKKEECEIEHEHNGDQ
jgi:zinc transport system ATP-binding protein